MRGVRLSTKAVGLAVLMEVPDDRTIPCNGLARVPYDAGRTRRGAPVRSEPKVGDASAWRPLVEGGDREKLGGSDDTLATAAVDADLEHERATSGSRRLRR